MLELLRNRVRYDQNH